MSEPTISTEKNGPVTTVILRRPQVRNAVDRATAAALADAFLAFERDDEARVGVLFGDHGTFCAGADLKAVATATGENRMPVPAVGDAFDRLATDGPMGPSRMLLSKPVIAAVAGHAVAGGLELALWCDLRVAEENAVFGVFCRRWGVPLLDGGTIRLPRIIGMGRALDLILTGRPVGAGEALQIGLANRVVPAGRARAEAESLAAEIARFPQLCMRSDRLSAYEQWDLSLDRALHREYEHGIGTIRSGETREGAMRFASGRGRGGRFDDL
jgi:enoyl-CoA hydratase